MRSTFIKLISDFIFPCLVAMIALLFIPGIADGQVNWPGRQKSILNTYHQLAGSYEVIPYTN